MPSAARPTRHEDVDHSDYLPSYGDTGVNQDFRERQRECADELNVSQRSIARGVGKSRQWLNEVLFYRARIQYLFP